MRKLLTVLLVALGATILFSSFTEVTVAEKTQSKMATFAKAKKSMMMVYAYSKCYEHSGATNEQLMLQNADYVRSHSWGTVLYTEVDSHQSIAGFPTHAWRTCVTTYYYWFQPV